MQQASGRKFKGIRRRVGSAFPDAHAWSSRRVTPVRLPPVQPSPEPMTRFLLQRPRRCRVTKYRSLHKFQHQRTAQYVILYPQVVRHQQAEIYPLTSSSSVIPVEITALATIGTSATNSDSPLSSKLMICSLRDIK